MGWADGEQSDTGYYDVGEVCLNGHPTTGFVNRIPSSCRKHCDKCGEPTIQACPHCKHAIQGDYYSPSFACGTLYDTPPAYCHNCGNAFPWTESKIQAAIELAVEVAGLADDDAKQFNEAVHDVVKDSPRTQLAAIRVKNVLAKGGQQLASAFRDIIVDLASESAKKIIWPDK